MKREKNKRHKKRSSVNLEKVSIRNTKKARFGILVKRRQKPGTQN